MTGRVEFSLKQQKDQSPFLSQPLRRDITCSCRRRCCCYSTRPEQRQRCPTQTCAPTSATLSTGWGVTVRSRTHPLQTFPWPAHRGRRGQKTPMPPESKSISDFFIKLSLGAPSPGHFPSFLQSLALKHHLLLRSKDTRPGGRRTDSSS